MGDPHDDAWEYQERNRPPGNSDWDHWDKTLLRGMQSGDGLTLSRDQCWAVLKLLRYGRPKKQGERRSIKHPHDEGMEVLFRESPAQHSFLLEAEGYPTEAAVTAVANTWRISRATVFKRRREADRDATTSNIEKWRNPDTREWFGRIFEAWAQTHRDWIAKHGRPPV